MIGFSQQCVENMKMAMGSDKRKKEARRKRRVWNFAIMYNQTFARESLSTLGVVVGTCRGSGWREAVLGEK